MSFTLPVAGCSDELGMVHEVKLLDDGTMVVNKDHDIDLELSLAELGAEAPGCVKVWQGYNKNPRMIITVAADQLAAQYGTHYTAFMKAICYCMCVDYIRHVEPRSIHKSGSIESPYQELMTYATIMSTNMIAVATKTETGGEFKPSLKTMNSLASMLLNRSHKEAPWPDETQWNMLAKAVGKWVPPIMTPTHHGTYSLQTPLGSLARECLHVAAYPVEHALLESGVRLPDARFTKALEKEYIWQRRQLIKGITWLFERGKWPLVRP